MRIGINLLLWTAHVSQEHLPLFAKLKAAGYDGIEIPVMDVSDPAHFTMLGRIARDHGLDCTTSTALPAAQGSPISPEPAERRAASDYLRRVIECAHNTGADLLIGPIYQIIGRFTGSGPTEAELEHAAEVHREIAAYAEAAGLRCAVEPLNRFEAHLINTMEQARDYVRRVDHPALGAMHDTFHAHIEEKDPVASVETLYQTGKLFHVHISENDRGTPGRGHAQLRPTIAKLKSLGYDGWLTIEAFGSALPELASATRIWRSIFPDAEQVYSEGYRLVRDAWNTN
jgi:D-psicose/D-tagatose/L-ribulose 3-epimerase